jgi:hypothetical protein
MLKRSTLIIVGIFIVLLVVAVITQRNQDEAEQGSNSGTDLSYLIDVGESEIIAIEINSSDGSQVIVSRGTDGEWILDVPSNEVADESRIEAAVSLAGAMRTITKLDLKVDLADMGLDQAKNWIVVTLSNGEQKTAYIGDVTPTNSGYYAYATGVPVQVVDKFNVDGVLEILTEPPILTQLENEEK